MDLTIKKEHGALNLTVEKKQSYKCEYCQLYFVEIGVFLGHFPTCCDFQCQKCFRYFPSEKSNSFHFRYCSPFYSCLHCPQKFHTQQGQTIHNSRVHQIFRRTCNICFSSFDSLALLNEHKNNCKTDFFCATCVVYFDNQRGLSVHNGKLHSKVLINLIWNTSKIKSCLIKKVWLKDIVGVGDFVVQIFFSGHFG